MKPAPGWQQDLNARASERGAAPTRAISDESVVDADGVVIDGTQAIAKDALLEPHREHLKYRY